MSKICKEIKISIPEYISGELNEVECREIVNHIDSCECCRRDMEQMKLLIKDIDNLYINLKEPQEFGNKQMHLAKYRNLMDLLYPNIKIALSFIVAIIMITGSIWFYKTNIEMKKISAGGFGLASWVDHYYSFEVMAAEADLIVTAAPIEAKPEQRFDVKLSNQSMVIEDVIKGDKKTGDKINILLTPGMPGENVEFFQQNHRYILFLKYTTDGTGYCLIAGGYQGVGRVNSVGKMLSLVDIQDNNLLDGKKISDVKQIIKNNTKR